MYKIVHYLLHQRKPHDLRRSSADSAARALVPAMLEYRDTDLAAADVRAGNIRAYITDYPVVQYFTQVTLCLHM